ncbi:hypothetical protein [Streptomyces venezuelae]|nr:hypothetical protein [Streptomyces venezuelae]
MAPAGVAQGHGHGQGAGVAIPFLFLTQERDAHAVSPAADDDEHSVIASRFTVEDRSGAEVGGAFETCAKEIVGGRAVTAYCSGIIEIEGKGKIGFQASRAVSGDPDDDHALVTGVVTGGTGVYDGASGQMDLTPPDVEGGAWAAEFH